MQPQIIKEEKDYLVINKPAGLVVHSDGKTKEKTLCDFLLERYPETNGVGEPFKLADNQIIEKPGIVHRLDRDTSGVMLIARTDDGFEFFKNLFQNCQIQKTYHAFVYGNVKEDFLQIDAPIGRSKNDFRQWFAGKNARGKLRDALTEVKVLKRSSDKSVTFIEACPKTGRTHQIRVHLKSIGAPIVSDGLYAENRDKLLGFERLALHSYKITFKNEEGKSLEYVAEYPEDFEQAVNNFS